MKKRRAPRKRRKPVATPKKRRPVTASEAAGNDIALLGGATDEAIRKRKRRLRRRKEQETQAAFERRRRIAARSSDHPSTDEIYAPAVTRVDLSGTSGMTADATVIPGPLALHQEILRRLRSVEEAVAALSKIRAGIGHNKPPEPIEFLPFDNDDQQAVEAAISYNEDATGRT